MMQTQASLSGMKKAMISLGLQKSAITKSKANQYYILDISFQDYKGLFSYALLI